MNISQEDYFFLINHGVVPTEEQTKYKCTYCNCPIYSLHNAKQHVQGYLHNFVYIEKVNFGFSIFFFVIYIAVEFGA